MDGIFYYTGKGLNWDIVRSQPGLQRCRRPSCPALRMRNGYNTGDPTALNYYEWCQDHNKPLEVHPFGDVAGGGPVDLAGPEHPDQRCMVRRQSLSRARMRHGARGRTHGHQLPPSGTIANSPTERGRLCVHVALAQRARDHHQQYLSRAE